MCVLISNVVNQCADKSRVIDARFFCHAVGENEKKKETYDSYDYLHRQKISDYSTLHLHFVKFPKTGPLLESEEGIEVLTKAVLCSKIVSNLTSHEKYLTRRNGNRIFILQCRCTEFPSHHAIRGRALSDSSSTRRQLSYGHRLPGSVQDQQ